MKKWWLMGLLLLNVHVYAQEENEQAIEELKEREQEPDDLWNDPKLYPMIKLNTVSPETLELFDFLTSYQRLQFFNYRNTLGPFLSIWELQAVPGWDRISFDRIRPFLRTDLGGFNLIDDGGFYSKKRTVFLQRLGVTVSGLGSTNGKKTLFIGTRPIRSLSRIDFTLSSKLEAGITLEKDAGERWWSSSGPIRGMDFMSFRIRVRAFGRLKALYLGDYTVNIGQGLTIWQSMAFGKSFAIGSIKREGEVLRVYKGAGEYNFMRGVATQWKWRKGELSLFASHRKLDANTKYDSLTGSSYISSLISSGFHGSAASLEDARSLQMTVLGAVGTWTGSRGKIGAHLLQYQWSKPMQKLPERYNLYAISGRQLTQAGLHYSFLYKNIHWFGELVHSGRKGWGMILGGLVSVDAKTELSFLFRKIRPEYRSFWPNAFTESSSTANESGFFLGMEHRVSKKWRVVSYVDSYIYDWVKYRLGASTSGMEGAIGLFYSPSRRLSVQIIARERRKEVPETGLSTVLGQTRASVTKNIKYQFDYQFDSAWKARIRADWVGIGPKLGASGMVFSTDLIYKPLQRNWDIAVRWSLSKISDYESRIYVTERDVLYSFSVFSFDKSLSRIAINLHIKNKPYLIRKIRGESQFWLKFTQTVVSKNSLYNNVVGSGGEILSSELKIQWLQIL